MTPGLPASIHGTIAARSAVRGTHVESLGAEGCPVSYVARDDPQRWKRRFAAVAQDWAEYRPGSRAAPGDSDPVTG